MTLMGITEDPAKLVIQYGNLYEKLLRTRSTTRSPRRTNTAAKERSAKGKWLVMGTAFCPLHLDSLFPI